MGNINIGYNVIKDQSIYLFVLLKLKTKVYYRKIIENKLIKVIDLKTEYTFIFNKSDATFSNNKINPIHRWYPYIEGFSQGFVEKILNKYDDNILVYDPFNGSGTTTLTCAYKGIKSIGSEINPFMRFVSNTKVNTVYNILKYNKLHLLDKEIVNFQKIDLNKDNNVDVNKYINDCYIDKNFFNPEILIKIALIKKAIINIKDDDIKDLFKLALGSICVELSNMIRSVDLRRKRGSEINKIPSDVKQRYLEQLYIISNDIKQYSNSNIIPTKIISDDAKLLPREYNNTVDVIITSPPYVNGTNYFRNTKLELWILDFIKSDKDLKELRTKAITAGINNVSSRIKVEFKFESVEKIATLLDEKSPDKRIPKLIRAYFSDMNKVFRNFYYVLKPGGSIYFDIGDSQYYGVYIPVFEIIIQIARLNNLTLVDRKLIRNRKSKNGMLLSQELLIFKKENQRCKDVN